MNGLSTHLERFSLKGRRALITGATRGIGLEISKAMCEAGAKVYINGRDTDTLDKLCIEMIANGYQVFPAPFDVTEARAFEKWLEATAESPDILVNNAAIRHRYTISKITPEDFSNVIEVNLNSAFALARNFAMRLKNSEKSGAIINITSIAGPRARPGDAAYTAAKGGLDALTRSLAVELAPAGIRCNAIAPGYFATEANEPWVGDESTEKFIEARIPLKRWGKPEEIAGAAVFLASDAASYINGHTLVIDAGMTINF